MMASKKMTLTSAEAKALNLPLTDDQIARYNAAVDAEAAIKAQRAEVRRLLVSLQSFVRNLQENSPVAIETEVAYKNAVSLHSIAVRVQLCQPTAELQKAEVENARKWVDVAEKLGAGHIRVFGGTTPKGASEEQGIAWAAEVLKRCARTAVSGIGEVLTAAPIPCTADHPDSPRPGAARAAKHPSDPC
jgi:hypothetical protein